MTKLWYKINSPDLEINSTCWDFKHNAKGENMAKITIKPLSKNDPIFTKRFMTFSKFKNKRRNNEINNSKNKRLFIRKKKER